jgi:hypothetical protein
LHIGSYVLVYYRQYGRFICGARNVCIADEPLVSYSEHTMLYRLDIRMQSRTLHHTVWIAGGAISFLLTIYGCIASFMLDYRELEELSLAVCLVAPLPCFLIGLRSKRWSALLLLFSTSTTQGWQEYRADRDDFTAGTSFRLPAFS